MWICLLFNNFIVDHYCFNCLITICIGLSNEHCSLKYDFIFSHNLVYTGIRFIQDSVKTRFHSSSRKDVIANHDQGGHHGFLIDCGVQSDEQSYKDWYQLAQWFLRR